MRPSNKSRSRNKPGNNGGHNNNNNNQRRNNMGNIINRVFESAGPDGKVRGTPQQIIDKYQALARDAQVSGDRVAAESFLQYSEHYTRILGEAQRQQMENRYQGGDREDGPQNQRDDGFERRPQHQPQPQPQVQPVPSGLAMIDSDDAEDFGGPIETPEGRREQRRDPLPMADPQPTFEPPAFMAMPMAAPVEAPQAAVETPAPVPVASEPALPLEPMAIAEPVAEEPKVRKTRPRKRKPAAEVIAGDATPEAPAPEAAADAPAE